MANNNFNSWLLKMGEAPLPEVQPEFEIEELDRMLARLESQLGIDTSQPIEETTEAKEAENDASADIVIEKEEGGSK
jgi:hypothetical protein